MRGTDPGPEVDGGFELSEPAASVGGVDGGSSDDGGSFVSAGDVPPFDHSTPAGSEFLAASSARATPIAGPLATARPTPSETARAPILPMNWA